ncbi:MAG TPA: NAD(P)H-dependent glycerol-3-phosphate dehydrogenase [Bacteroidia bacterium]|nr:NAD(P)H-dependent glycerol-3-phosphate dehydrogenase [Bacteroidia bacterium]
MSESHKIAVIGGGSWATAIVKILSNSPVEIIWWLRSAKAVEHIAAHRHNPVYLSDVQIELTKVRPVADLQPAIDESDLIVLAVPSAFIKNTLAGLRPGTFHNKIIFSAIKGIVPEDLLIVGDFMHKHHQVPVSNIGVITGPCHAEEVALEKLSYLTIACQDTGHAALLAGLMNCRYIRTTVSDDIYGTEYAAVIKNIIAIASGMCHGLGYGDNFQAVLIANAIQEIKRFIDKVYPISRDINDSAYLGDLLVTAYSQFSRNRTFGSMIGKGYSVKSAQLEMNMVAEGYYAVKCIHAINQQAGTDLPVCNAVYNVLYGNSSASKEMSLLAEKLR